MCVRERNGQSEWQCLTRERERERERQKQIERERKRNYLYLSETESEGDYKFQLPLKMFDIGKFKEKNHFSCHNRIVNIGFS